MVLPLLSASFEQKPKPLNVQKLRDDIRKEKKAIEPFRETFHRKMDILGAAYNYNSDKPILGTLKKIIAKQFRDNTLRKNECETLFNRRELKSQWKKLLGNLKKLSKLLDKMTSRKYNPTDIWEQLNSIIHDYEKIEKALTVVINEENQLRKIK